MVFDVDCDCMYLNVILFVDYGVLFDLFIEDVLGCVLLCFGVMKCVEDCVLFVCCIDYVKCM